MWLQQNDELIAADLVEDAYFLESVRALLNYLFMSALKKHEVIATTLKEKIDELIVEQQEECAKYALKKAVTELYVEAQEKVVALYVKVEEESGKHLFKNSNVSLIYSYLFSSLKSQCAGLEKYFVMKFGIFWNPITLLKMVMMRQNYIHHNWLH